MATVGSGNRLKILFPVYKQVLSQTAVEKLINCLKQSNCIEWKGNFF